MKLHEIVTSLKQEVFKAQQDLIEQGWDEVKLEYDSGIDGYKVKLELGKGWGCTWMANIESGIVAWRQFGVDALTTANMLKDSAGRLAWFKVHDLVKFAEKPSTLDSVREDSKHVVSVLKLKSMIEAGKLKVYDAASVFSMTTSGVYPGSGLRSPSPFKKAEKAIIININGQYYLADLTGADTYIRFWAYIDYNAA